MVMVDYFIGIGFCQSVCIAGNYAHNDWVEFLIGMGLIGIVIYFFFYLSLFRYFLFRKKICNLSSFSLIVYMLFLTSLYSMAFFNEPSCFCFILLGYLAGKNEYQRCLVRCWFSSYFMFSVIDDWNITIFHLYVRHHFFHPVSYDPSLVKNSQD